MRSILIDWLVEVHRKFKLLPETLFMTVSLIDRYLSIETCTREKLQLVGVASFFIATKYEEIYPPPLLDFAEITQMTFSPSDILEMEGKIICVLNFSLTVPSSLRFLERYTHVDKMNSKSVDMSLYLLELSLVDAKFVSFQESLKAAAAVYLTKKLFKRSTCWSPLLAADSQYSETVIRQCAYELCQVL